MNSGPKAKPSPQINPAALLPPDWDVAHDVLLIVGEGAGAIAAPFVRYGLERVITMFPRPVQPEAVPEGAELACSRGDLSRIVNLYGGQHPRRYATIRTPSCSLDAATTNGIQSMLAKLVKRKNANQQSQDHLAPLWATNGLKNLPHVANNPMIDDLGDAFRGVPIIIVGAGPSLSKNIDHLKAAQGKAIILCVNRALRSLQNAGVWPDFAINLEPQDVASQFVGIDLSRIPGLILSVTSHPALFELGAPQILSFSGNLEAEGWMFDATDEIREVNSGGSVSCSALSLCLRWGCDPIMLVGQDLSFPGGAYYHAGGVDGATTAVYDEGTKTWELKGLGVDLSKLLKGRNQEAGLHFDGTEVPGYFGGTVPTSTDFAAFREWFEHTALDHKEQVTLLNCTEGGAYIEGMEHIPLEVALKGLPDRAVNPADILQGEHLSHLLAPRQARMSRRIESLTEGLRTAISQAQACIQMIDQLSGDPEEMDQLQQAERVLQQTLRTVTVLSLMDQAGIRNAMARGQAATSMEESLAASQSLYQFIVDEGKRLLA
jgi:hypothetical protein